MSAPAPSPSPRPDAPGALLDLFGFGLFAALAGWVMVSGAAAGGDPMPVVGVAVVSGMGLLLGRFVGARSPLLVVGTVLLVAVILAVPTREDLVWGHPLGGPFGYSNATGAFFAQATMAGLILAVVARRPVIRAVGWMAVIAFTGVAVGSRSTAASILLVLLSAAALLGWRWGRVRMVVILFAGMVVAGVTITVIVGGTYAGEQSGALAKVTDRTVGERRAVLWRDAVDIMLDSPLVGAGPGSFRRLSQTALSDPDALWAHNEFLQLGAETGVPGLLLLMLVFVWGFARLRAAPTDPVVALAAAAIATIGIHSSIDYVMHFPAIPIAAAALLGVATAPRGRWDHTRSTGRNGGGR